MDIYIFIGLVVHISHSMPRGMESRTFLSHHLVSIAG
jgi:hypothetical protein